MSQDATQYTIIVNNIYNVITAIEGLSLASDNETKENLLWQKRYYEARLKDSKQNPWRITFTEEGKLVTPINPDSQRAIEGFIKAVSMDMQRKLQRNYPFAPGQLEDYAAKINKIYAYIGSDKQIDPHGYIIEGPQR